MQLKLGIAWFDFGKGELPPFADEEVQYNKARGRERNEENAQQRDVWPPERLRTQPERGQDRCRRDVELNSVLRSTRTSD